MGRLKKGKKNTKTKKHMAQGQRPGNRDGDVTKIEGQRKGREKETRVMEQAKEQASPDVLKVRDFLNRYDLTGLKDFLKSRGGEVVTVSSDTRSRAEKNVGRIAGYEQTWDIKRWKKNVEKLVSEENFLDALRFTELQEQPLIEAWVQSLLEQKLFHQAGSLLKSYAATKPQKKMDEQQIAIESDIDAEIMDGVEHQLGNRGQEMQIHLDYRYERIWSMVHDGYYAQAAEMCDQLDEEFFGKTKTTNETPEQLAKSHKAAVMRALPPTPGEMQKVFENLPELLAHFNHLAAVDKGDLPFLEALQSQFQLFIERLFDQKKIVIHNVGVVQAEEHFLDLVDQMGDIGLHMYIDSLGMDNHLYLMSDEEVPEGFWPVDLRLLSANDIVIDPENFEKQNGHPTPEIPDNEKTLAGVPKYAWTTKIVSIAPKKADELRKAA